MSTRKFPEFNLTRLLNTVFEPEPGERVAIMIDLPDPSLMKKFAFLEDPSLDIQKNAYEFFYRKLHENTLQDLQLKGGHIVAYKMTEGSNLDLPPTGVLPSGETVELEKDFYPSADIILCISTFSATAPLTAFAKKFGFRGATLHGLNKVILESGLCVDYQEVSTKSENLRLGMTRADAVEIDFVHDASKYTLRLELGKQEAQKSHGLCRGKKPDVANLPAGEIYYVPRNAHGQFPMRFDDGTIALMEVADCAIKSAKLLAGSEATLDEYRARMKSDPAAAKLGELGFGTQDLPVSGRDIQDEKVLGTLHVATGRSDHLGGDIVPGDFNDPRNAAHEDILYSPAKTPEINVPEARIYKDGVTSVLIRDYRPAEFMNKLISWD
jgi:aminopeptidase